MGLIDRFEVSVTIGLNSIPMAVPHTRPAGVTAHATRRDLISGYEPWLQRVQVPGSAGHLLEFRLGQSGPRRDRLRRARAALRLARPNTRRPRRCCSPLSPAPPASCCPPRALRTAADAVRVDIDRQVEETDDAAGVVRALEEQYDAFTRGRAGNNLLGPQTGPLPTADELGAELERFLASQPRPATTRGA